MEKASLKPGSWRCRFWRRFFAGLDYKTLFLLLGFQGWQVEIVKKVSFLRWWQISKHSAFKVVDSGTFKIVDLIWFFCKFLRWRWTSNPKYLLHLFWLVAADRVLICKCWKEAQFFFLFLLFFCLCVCLLISMHTSHSSREWGNNKALNSTRCQLCTHIMAGYHWIFFSKTRIFNKKKRCAKQTTAVSKKIQNW